MKTTDQDSRSTACRLRIRSLVPPALAFLALLLVAPALFAYVVKLKDGSLLFARAPYTVKGAHAVITLENGSFTRIPLDKVDVPGTEKYNRENYRGNVIAIDVPQEKGIQKYQLAAAVRASRSRAASSDSTPSTSPVLSGGPAVPGPRRLPRLN